MYGFITQGLRACIAKRGIASIPARKLKYFRYPMKWTLQKANYSAQNYKPADRILSHYQNHPKWALLKTPKSPGVSILSPQAGGESIPVKKEANGSLSDAADSDGETSRLCSKRRGCIGKRPTSHTIESHWRWLSGKHFYQNFIFTNT